MRQEDELHLDRDLRPDLTCPCEQLLKYFGRVDIGAVDNRFRAVVELQVEARDDTEEAWA